MPLDELSFRLGDTGVVLNPDVVVAPMVDILRVYGLDSSPIRETERDHEGVDGGFMDAEFEKGRPIMLDGEVIATTDTIEAYLDGLKANYASTNVNTPFYFKAPGVAERIVFVKPRGVRYDWAPERRVGTSRIQFVMYAEDPRIYDSVLQSLSIPYGGAATSGFGFNLGFNLSFGATVPVSGGIVVVNGNRPTPALLTITGPVVNPQVINVTDGITLSFTITLGASDSLVVDLNYKTVLLNGNVNRRSALVAPNWFLFNSGSTNIVFGGVSGSGDLLIQWRNAWR